MTYNPLNDHQIDHYYDDINWDERVSVMQQQCKYANHLAAVMYEMLCMDHMSVKDFNAAGGLTKWHDLEEERNHALRAYRGE